MGANWIKLVANAWARDITACLFMRILDRVPYLMIRSDFWIMALTPKLQKGHTPSGLGVLGLGQAPESWLKTWPAICETCWRTSSSKSTLAIFRLSVSVFSRSRGLHDHQVAGTLALLPVLVRNLAIETGSRLDDGHRSDFHVWCHLRRNHKENQ